MAENGKSSSSVPWQALLAILAATGGALVMFSPLQSSRPPDPDNHRAFVIGPQDVGARLWQDPFKVIGDLQENAAPIDDLAHTVSDFIKAIGGPRGEPAAQYPAHDLAELQEQIAKAQSGGDSSLLVLGVMLQANPYSELAEFRRRARVAVLEGLGRGGFTPVDGEHISYFQMGWTRRRMAAGDAEDDATTDTLKSGGKVAAGGTLRVPYEWFGRATPRMAGSPPVIGRLPLMSVLVIWLDNAAFSDRPLTRLGSFFRALQPEKKTTVAFKIIGPHATPVLANMVSEVRTELSGKTKQALAGAEMFAATPTAEDALLLQWSRLPGSIGGVQSGTVADYLEAGAAPPSGPRFHFHRTTVTDKEMCDALIDELELRGVKLRQSVPWGLADSNEEIPALMLPNKHADDVAIVAEWDTFYGRALPLSFAMAMFPPGSLARAAIRDQRAFPAWVHPFVYLRGIDGQAPGEQSTDAAKKESDKKAPAASGGFRFTAPSEPPEGVKGSDYLRRLAEQLARLDDQLLRQNGRGLRAVGILGTDVYDKLMVLRALRDRLPGTVFFTTQLDARFNLPEEWKSSHNLLIVSPFGLTLNRYYQRDIPPFRATAQTAMFVATLAAVTPEPAAPGSTQSNPLKGLGALGLPRRFVIGRAGAVEITPEWPHKDDDEFRDTRPDSIHPPRDDPQTWWSMWRQSLSVLIFVAIVVSLGWCWILVNGAPSRTAPRAPDLNHKYLRASGRLCRRLGEWLFRSSSSTGFFIILVVPLTVIFIWALAQAAGPSGEPLRWFSGVSVWPTEAIRVIVAALSVCLIVRARRRTKTNDGRVAREFRLVDPTNASPVNPPLPTHDVPRSRLTRILDRIRIRRLSFSDWRIYVHNAGNVPMNIAGHDSAALSSQEPITECKLPRDPRDRAAYQVDAHLLWSEYLRSGRLWERVGRVAPGYVAYMLIGLLLTSMFGLPFSPARGNLARFCDTSFLTVAVLCSTALLFYVLDGAHLNYHFIRHLSEGNTRWPTGTFNPEGVFQKYTRWGLGLDLSPYLDIRLIAMRTDVVGSYIYYPFLTLLLMLLSRNSFFDDWDWPPGLLAILAMSASLALLAAWLLRGAAEKARAAALTTLRNTRRKLLADEHGKARADVVSELVQEVESERQGAFSILSQYPTLAALLLPSGGIGLWMVIEYIAKPGG